ncbi:hypothetical protein [Fischerella thermalis]|jgi:hypothetical protein|uniref:Uncharacterized protein n=1 Tax=Fischerella thermalis JSC-11 TaxID=741277 RepID=G6FYB1_9CYAN|nr:hypothetical protein [Fischerella thermalis]PLZ82212.1 hypothetical protein CBP16_07620 [Fischerella thermalis WC217]PMB00974.1 hypothetical protein CI592_18495 [Fischerella thermalis CCMEE 5328]PMB11063.1 hypothetical protein CEN49_02635 [Fischerella thermalis CCMEE 5273]PMB44337.1 hypothetical protein CEN39_28420 [Fischerella thermalis CCMEE 5201]EHC09688.1 hypothetical protein FJSC11DRAFT_3860 [Fischerella thermalis JSC-11]
MYYYPSQPPYLLLIIGLFTALTSGLALAGTLKVIVNKWQSDGAEKSSTQLSIKQLSIPFLGITVGVTLFMCSGFEIFGFPPLLAYAVGIPVTILTSLLVWFQLGSMMSFVERRGMQSLDLDSMN